jgi:hypothetical protein
LKLSSSSLHHYCAIKKLNGTVQTTKEMKILLKRGLWSHKTGHISNTIYDRKLKFGTQVKDFITYTTTIQSSFNATFNYIMATSVSGGGREPPTMGKQLVNFITCGCKSSASFFLTYKAGREPTPYW